jgi:hypothetical protein
MKPILLQECDQPQNEICVNLRNFTPEHFGAVDNQLFVCG